MSFKIISLDWLSGTGTLTNGTQSFNSQGFRWEQQKLGTKIFRTWYKCFSGNFQVADVLLHPSTPILKPDSCHWKIHNSYLYRFHGSTSHYDLFKSIGIDKPIVTRADICCDFLVMDNGYQCTEFISDIINGHIIRKGSKRFKCEGTQLSNEPFHYLRFGSRTSPVCLYLYNKSKEMRDKEFKPWIYDIWHKHSPNLTKDVWRLEFSIIDNRLIFHGFDSGLTHRITDIGLCSFDIIKHIFNVCLERYCDFRIKDNNKRIDRMTRFNIFNKLPEPSAIYIADASRSHNNYDRAMIKRLVAIERDLRNAKMLTNTYFRDTILDVEKVYGLKGYSDSLE